VSWLQSSINALEDQQTKVQVNSKHCLSSLSI